MFLRFLQSAHYKLSYVDDVDDDHKSQYVFTKASSVSPVQKLAARESVFRQLDQTQHHLWYSTCHCACNPNANNTAQSHTVFHSTMYSIHTLCLYKLHFNV